MNYILEDKDRKGIIYERTRAGQELYIRGHGQDRN